MEGAAPLPRSILFLCGMNAIRSPMAEALARALLPRGIFINSAGVRAGPPDPFVEASLEERGITLGERQSQKLEDLEDAYFDLIITLAPEAHHAALELTRTMSIEVEYWPTADPSAATGSRERILDSYRDVRDRLEARIRTRFFPGKPE